LLALVVYSINDYQDVIMIKLKSISLVALSLLTLITLLLCPTAIYASVGTFDIGAGVINMGSAGVGAAMPQDALAGAINPASISFVPNTRLDAGLTLIFPDAGYDATTSNLPSGVPIYAGSQDSSVSFIPSPSLGYLHHIKNTDLTYAFALHGIGISTDYEIPIFGAGDAGACFRKIMADFSASWQATPKLSLGGSFLVATQTLSIDGISSFSALSIDPSNLSNRGTDYNFGAGAKVGFMYKPIPILAIGGSYSPEIAMSKMDRYAGLLPNKGDLDIPPTAVAGFALQITPTLQAGFDTQYIWYNVVPAYSNPFVCTPGSKCLGNSSGTGFGWRNATLYKFGLVWQATPTWILRGGYLYTDELIPSSQILLATVAPATSQSHFTLGLTHIIKQKFALSALALYAPQESITGNNNFAPDQRIMIHMSEFEIGLSLGYLFNEPKQHQQEPYLIIGNNHHMPNADETI
jgi:long-chain fatty acid transport protein